MLHTMKTKNAFTLTVGVLLLTTFVVLACHPSDVSFDRPDFVITPEETILPMDIVLPLGKTVRIEVGQCTILFRTVLEDSVTGKSVSRNGKVLLEVKYEDSVKHVELNTVEIPRTYTLENGLFYNLELVGLRITDGTYEIILRFNGWAWL